MLVTSKLFNFKSLSEKHKYLPWVFFASVLFGAVFLCSSAGLKFIQSQVENQGDNESTFNGLISNKLNHGVLGSAITGTIFLLGGLVYRINADKGRWIVGTGIALFIAGTALSIIHIWDAAGPSGSMLTLIAMWLLLSAMGIYMGSTIFKKTGK